MTAIMIAEGKTSASTEAGLADFGSVYEAYVRLLVGTAMENFRVCEMDAQTLAHEVFLAYFLKAHEVINPRAWLLSAISNASKHYLRTRARLVELPAEYRETPNPAPSPAESFPDQLMAREVICCLTARCQLALRLRYLEGYSVPEVAAELDTTVRYAQKLVGRCLRQAQQRYAAKEHGEHDRTTG